MHFIITMVENCICTTHFKHDNGKYSAGIMPYTIVNGTIYLLLGKDKYERSWADFGGKVEKSDDNEIAATAAREFDEETLGSIVPYYHMIQKLRNMPVESIIKSTTLNGSPYYMYVIQIPYNPNYRIFFSKIVDYMCSLNNYRMKKSIEKCEIRWTSIHTIKASIYHMKYDRDPNTLHSDHEMNDGRMIKLRNVYLETMKCNIKKIETIISNQESGVQT